MPEVLACMHAVPRGLRIKVMYVTASSTQFMNPGSDQGWHLCSVYHSFQTLTIVFNIADEVKIIEK